MNIGDKIKEQRLIKGWTQEQVATLLNVSRSAVSSWEVGRNYPDLETIVAISDLFNISLDRLLREDKEMTKNVTKKMKMNRYYKGVLIMIGVLCVMYVGTNITLRVKENRYRTNLEAYGWKVNQEGQAQWDSNGYDLLEGEMNYYTYILPTGLTGVPLKEQKVNIITRKDKLVIDVTDENHIELVMAKSNDKDVTHFAKVTVNKNQELAANNKEWSESEKEFITGYMEKYEEEYQEMIDHTLMKRQEIITRHKG